MTILKRIRPQYILFILIAVHLLFLSGIRFFPYPELFIYSYLTEQGLVPYEQILDQHFPGVMFFPINLASLGLANIFQTRVIHLFLVGLTQILIFFVGKRLFGSEAKALMANLLFIVWQPFLEGNVLWIDSFIPPILLFSFLLLISSKEKGKELLYSGVLLGIALLFKQTVAPLIVLIFIYFILIKRSLFDLKQIILGLFPPILLLLAWVTVRGIWSDFIYWTFTFNLTTFSEMGRKYPSLSSLVRSAPVILLPFAYIIYIKKKEKDYILLFLFFLGSLAFAYARFDYIHLQPALPFAAILIVLIFNKIPNKLRKLSIALYIIVAVYLIKPIYLINKGNGVVFFGDFERQLSNKVLTYAGKGDTIFSLGTSPHVYYLTETLPPGRLFVFQFPWFMRIAEERILSGIISDPPKVVVRDESATTGGMKLIDYMSEINRYINNNYHVIDNIGEVEFLVRN